jgi:hypothetical protein
MFVAESLGESGVVQQEGIQRLQPRFIRADGPSSLLGSATAAPGGEFTSTGCTT